MRVKGVPRLVYRSTFGENAEVVEEERQVERGRLVVVETLSKIGCEPTSV